MLCEIRRARAESIERFRVPRPFSSALLVALSLRAPSVSCSFELEDTPMKHQTSTTPEKKTHDAALEKSQAHSAAAFFVFSSQLYLARSHEQEAETDEKPRTGCTCVFAAVLSVLHARFLPGQEKKRHLQFLLVVLLRTSTSRHSQTIGKRKEEGQEQFSEEKHYQHALTTEKGRATKKKKNETSNADEKRRTSLVFAAWCFPSFRPVSFVFPLPFVLSYW